MNIILSGATGYFGSLAKRYLEDAGHRVLTAGRNKGSDYLFDLNSLEDFSSIDSESADVFIHAAAVNEVECVERPYSTIYKNVAGTRAALDFCVKNSIETFVYISTFHVYGKDSGLIDEKTDTEPLHDYGLTHLQAEEYVRLYTRKGLVKGVTLRPSNMFDVPASLAHFNRWSLTPFGFCKAAIEKGEIVLKTPGFQERNFVSIKDIISVVETVIEGTEERQILNVFGVNTLSIRQLAQLVKDVMKEDFDRDVELKMPRDTSILGKELYYKSRYISCSKKHIKDHITELCRKLISVT